MSEGDETGAGREEQGNDLGCNLAITAQANRVSKENGSKVKREREQPRAQKNRAVDLILPLPRNMRNSQRQLDRLYYQQMIQVSVKWRLAVVAGAKSSQGPQCHLVAVPAFDATPTNSVQTKEDCQKQRQRKHEIETRFMCHPA